MARGKYHGEALPEQDRKAIIEAYLQGKFIRQICSEFQHGSGTVRRELDSAGIRGII
jgi:DNA-directed RNA polymerase specialized sigma24 family protein